MVIMERIALTRKSRLGESMPYSVRRMVKREIGVYSICLTLFFFLMSCGTAEKAAKKEAAKGNPAPAVRKPRSPDIVIRFGSIALSTLNRKLDMSDIRQLSTVLRKDTVDILAMQNITRYPDLPDREDIVSDLQRATGMYAVFGETVSLNGRQNGNATFSYYPIQSRQNTPYQNLHSLNFESAFQTIIDCGAQTVVVVSTLLPDKTTLDEQSSIVTALENFSTFYVDHPIIIGGNLPRADFVRSMTRYNDVHALPPGDASRIWYSKTDDLLPLHIKTERISLGVISIAEFAVFRSSNH